MTKRLKVLLTILAVLVIAATAGLFYYQKQLKASADTLGAYNAFQHQHVIGNPVSPIDALIHEDQIISKVITLPPTNITANSIIPHGNIVGGSGASIAKRGFRLTKIQNIIQADYVDSGSFGAGEFTKTNVTLSLPNTIYYIQAYAIDSVGKTYAGDWLSFKSLPISYTTPKVTTLTPTNVTATTIVPHGNITDAGGYSITYRGFQYSRVNTGSALVSIYDSGKFSAGAYTKIPIISNLTPNTTYYVRAFAINAKGTTYASWVQFKTLAK